MKEVFPKYSEDILFYAVNIDPSEDIDSISEYGKEQGYSWELAQSNNEMLSDLNVLQQSTKLAFDKDGVIRYRAGFGEGSIDCWGKVFENLVYLQ